LSAFAIAFLLLGEVYVYAALPHPKTTIEYMDLFLKNSLFGLLHFDLLGMISYLFFIPLIISLYIVLRRNSGSIMLIATVLFFVGVTVFYSTNTSFSMLSLSKQYSIAETEAEKTMLLTAFQSMVTLFKVNAFMVSYVIVSFAWIMIASIMLFDNLFSRITAYFGIIAGASGIIAEICENTSIVLLSVSIIFYFAAIVFLFVWVILTGKQLLTLGSNSRIVDK
jgi:Domain of unknown function (DUF4386)